MLYLFMVTVEFRLVYIISLGKKKGSCQVNWKLYRKVRSSFFVRVVIAYDDEFSRS